MEVKKPKLTSLEKIITMEFLKEYKSYVEDVDALDRLRHTKSAKIVLLPISPRIDADLLT